MKTNNAIKTTLATLTAAALAWLGTTPAAEAGWGRHGGSGSRVYVSGHCHCGLPVYTERYLAGYDCHGRPVWAYRQVNRHYHATIRPHGRHPITPRPYPYHRQPSCGVSIHGVIR